jgi:outer membrane protein TolC
MMPKTATVNFSNVLVFLVFCLMAAVVPITVAEASTLSLIDAINTALTRNPQIAAADAQVRAATHRVTQASAGTRPQVNAYEKFNNTTNPMWAFGTKLNQEQIGQTDFAPEALNDPDPINNFATVLEVAWPLYDGGKTRSGRRQAQLSQEMVQLGLERARQQIIAETIGAYAGWLLSIEDLKVVEQTLAMAEANLKMVQNRFEAGFFVKSDLLRAQVRITQLEQQHAHAQNMVSIARARLAAAMAVDIHDVSVPKSQLADPLALESNLSQWIELALAQRAELRQAQFKRDIAAQEIDKVRAQRLPGINLVGNYEINTERWDDFGDNYTVGAVMNLSLYSGQRLSARQKEATALLEAAQAECQSRELAVGLEVRQAYFGLQSALESTWAAEKAIDQARENQRIIENRYANGLETIVTMLDAELVLQKTQSDYFQRVHDYHVALAQLMLAAGTIDDEQALSRFEAVADSK